MSNTSRAITNHYFQEAIAIELPRGHPTIALNSEQVQSILRVVADESARASYAMMEDIIERARRLSLSNLPARRPDQRDISEGGSAPTSDAETYSDRETDRAGSFTSGALRTDDDSNSIGYSYEFPSPSLVNIAQPPQRRGPMQTDLASPEPQQFADSPGAHTLAALKEEARKDQPSKGRKSKIPGKPRTTRRKVTRSCKIMKEEYFEGMAWTRTFVSGPVDPSGIGTSSTVKSARATCQSMGKEPGRSCATMRQKNI